VNQGAGDASGNVRSSTSSLVISLEGAELTISSMPGGFSYTIEEVDPSDKVVIASGFVGLNGKGNFLLYSLMNVFRFVGPYKFGKFEVRVVEDLELGFSGDSEQLLAPKASVVDSGLL
jgi:hypothetical protein